jgi:hypothetical protein
VVSSFKHRDNFTFTFVLHFAPALWYEADVSNMELAFSNPMTAPGSHPHNTLANVTLSFVEAKPAHRVGTANYRKALMGERI